MHSVLVSCTRWNIAVDLWMMAFKPGIRSVLVQGREENPHEIFSSILESVCKTDVCICYNENCLNLLEWKLNGSFFLFELILFWGPPPTLRFFYPLLDTERGEIGSWRVGKVVIYETLVCTENFHLPTVEESKGPLRVVASPCRSPLRVQVISIGWC